MVKRHILTGAMAIATFAAFSISNANADSLNSTNKKRNESVTKASSTYEKHTKENRSEYKDGKYTKEHKATKPKIKHSNNNKPTQVPEPATMVLLGSAMGGLALARRLRKKLE